MNDHIDEAPGNPGGQLIPDNSLTAAELRIARESLGLTLEAAAKILCVNERTFRRWEFGYTPRCRCASTTVAGWARRSPRASLRRSPIGASLPTRWLISWWPACCVILPRC